MRVVLKISGEALADREQRAPISPLKTSSLAGRVSAALREDESLQLAIVVGGGNLVRGKDFTHNGKQSVRGDHMGMLGTVINALALQDAFEDAGVASRVMSAVEMPRLAEPFIHGRALRHLDKGRVVIFGSGIGVPYCTTDYAAAVRATEIGAEYLLLAKYGTDGIYSADPRLNMLAEKHVAISYGKVLEAGLEFMDLPAVAHCQQRALPVYVFEMDAEDSIEEALRGDFHQGSIMSAAESRDL